MSLLFTKLAGATHAPQRHFHLTQLNQFRRGVALSCVQLATAGKTRSKMVIFIFFLIPSFKFLTISV